MCTSVQWDCKQFYHLKLSMATYDFLRDFLREKCLRAWMRENEPVNVFERKSGYKLYDTV